MSALSRYRNVKVNLTEPRSKTDFTAVAILSFLNSDPTRERFAQDVKAHVERSAGAAANHIGKAYKALRNMGYPIYAKKHRHMSYYVLAGTPSQYAEFADRVTAETYSQCISAIRSLHTVLANNPADPLIAAAHTNLQNTAIALGQKAGLTVHEVVDELAVLS